MSKKGTNPRKTYILCLKKQKKGVYFTVLNEGTEFDLMRMVPPNTVKGSAVLTGIRQGVPKNVIRKTVFPALLLILILCVLSAAPAENAGFTPGDWALN